MLSKKTSAIKNQKPKHKHSYQILPTTRKQCPICQQDNCHHTKQYDALYNKIPIYQYQSKADNIRIKPSKKFDITKKN